MHERLNKANGCTWNRTATAPNLQIPRTRRTKLIEGVIDIRLVSIALEVKLLELDAGDVTYG